MVISPITSLPSPADTNRLMLERLQLPGIDSPASPSPANSPAVASDGFTQALTNAVAGVSGLVTNADKTAGSLALNQGVDIHTAMIAMDQASLGINLATTVRDKAVEAYQTLMNMQM